MGGMFRPYFLNMTGGIQMQERLKNFDEIRVFILFLMYNLKIPLEYELLNEAAVQDGIVAGLDFADGFADLLEKGNIEEIKNGTSSPKYKLTMQGIHIVESYQNDLTNSIRTQGLRSAMRLLDFKQRGSEIKTRYEMRDDGRYDLWCEIIEERQVTFQIKIIADNAAQLELMRYTFDQKPETVYKGVLTLLTGKSDYLLS